MEAVEARVRFALGAAATWSASEELVASDGRFECGAAATAVRRIRLAAEGHLPMETSWPVVGPRLSHRGNGSSGAVLSSPPNGGGRA